MKKTIPEGLKSMLILTWWDNFMSFSNKTSVISLNAMVLSYIAPMSSFFRLMCTSNITYNGYIPYSTLLKQIKKFQHFDQFSSHSFVFFFFVSPAW